MDPALWTGKMKLLSPEIVPAAPSNCPRMAPERRSPSLEKEKPN